MSKSPMKVLQIAYDAGREALSDDLHSIGSRTFLRSQLFACLVLKAYFQTDYLGIEAILRDAPGIGASIGMDEVPPASTLQMFERRLLAEGKR